MDISKGLAGLRDWAEHGLRALSRLWCSVSSINAGKAEDPYKSSTNHSQFATDTLAFTF